MSGVSLAGVSGVQKVADSGYMVIQKRGLSIVDTHELAIAMPLYPFFVYVMDSCPHRNKIFLTGRHQEVRQSVSSATSHHITSVSNQCVSISRNHEDIRRFCLVSFFRVQRLGEGGNSLEYGEEI